MDFKPWQRRVLKDRLVEIGHQPPDKKGRASMRRAVLRVLEQLQQFGCVGIKPGLCRGGSALYFWSLKSAT